MFALKQSSAILISATVVAARWLGVEYLKALQELRPTNHGELHKRSPVAVTKEVLVTLKARMCIT